VPDQPWDFGQARLACRDASQAQIAAEESMKNAAKDHALAEERYRKALAVEIVTLHNDGVAWSTCADLARGDDKVAELRRKRDIAEGVREAMVQAAWRRAADRKDAQRFADWSQRREFAEAYGQVPEPELATPIGAGRAA
jgi:hypothetical protein